VTTHDLAMCYDSLAQPESHKFGSALSSSGSSKLKPEPWLPAGLGLAQAQAAAFLLVRLQ
jgi:hypothetical protein